VKSLRELNFHVVAAGDSYNDTTMLLAADAGFLFHAPEHVRAEFPQLPALDDYGELLERITEAL
jgi:phosphoserine/homoserine phosphotransferase